jgi:RNA polymerase I-specific transcription initiation factor RRN7
MREERTGCGSSVTGTMMFSSQSEGETDNDTDATGARSMASRRSRKSIVTEDKLPKLVEMLGLCYLGMLLLRLPTGFGELCKWAMRGEMIYARGVSGHLLKI